MTALVLFDLICLTGEQGFIHLHTPRQHNGVGTDLIPRLQTNHIVLHQLLGDDFTFDAIPNHRRMWRIENTHLFQSAFGADFLDNPHQRIDNNNR